MGNTYGCFTVHQNRLGIKEQFGKFSSTMEPGCHFVPWCCGYKVAGYLSLRVQGVNVRCETKTKDNAFVVVVASVQYRAIKDSAYNAYYSLSNAGLQVQPYIKRVIRGTVPKMLLDDVFEEKGKIADSVKKELDKAMRSWGYEILGTLITDIEPDESVKRAMNEINTAQRLRVAAQDKAEAVKILQVKNAEGEAEAKVLSGQGVARQRQAIVEGLRESAIAFSQNVPGATAKDVIDMVLMTQYFDTMKEIGASSKHSTVFIPPGPAAVAQVAREIRNGLP